MDADVDLIDDRNGNELEDRMDLSLELRMESDGVGWTLLVDFGERVRVVGLEISLF